VRLITRRAMLAAGGTLAAGLTARKPRAQELSNLADALVPTDPPVAAPDIVFIGGDGEEHHLTEFLGHGMVINLWATWCVPCVAEMPALAALSKTLAPDDIAVLPLSSDRGGANAVQAFYQDHGITGLPVLLDPNGAAVRACHARGIPTSLIIDKKDWSTPAAAAIVRKLVAG
jgi:thiol-disulfide isomerase/thioredoxin